MLEIVILEVVVDLDLIIHVLSHLKYMKFWNLQRKGIMHTWLG